MNIENTVETIFNEKNYVLIVSENQEFWKRYHIENDKPYMFESTITDLINDLNVRSVLEIGCGLGNNLKNLTNEEIVGIDISEHAINSARYRFPKYKFYVGNILNIPLKETFDLVFTAAVIEHVKPELVDRAFEEMLRVSNKYVLNIEAYDKTEHEIVWHRGRNEFWTTHVAQRWKKFPVSIELDQNFDSEYRITLVVKQ